MPPLPHTGLEFPYKRPWYNLTLTPQEIEVGRAAGAGWPSFGLQSRRWRAWHVPTLAACSFGPPLAKHGLQVRGCAAWQAHNVAAATSWRQFWCRAGGYWRLLPSLGFPCLC
jgi:hypothetical protein